MCSSEDGDKSGEKKKRSQNTWIRKLACTETKPNPGSQSKIPKKNNITDPSLLSDSKEDDQDYPVFFFLSLLLFSDLCNITCPAAGVSEIVRSCVTLQYLSGDNLVSFVKCVS